MKSSFEGKSAVLVYAIIVDWNAIIIIIIDSSAFRVQF